MLSKKQYSDGAVLILQVCGYCVEGSGYGILRGSAGSEAYWWGSRLMHVVSDVPDTSFSKQIQMGLEPQGGISRLL